MKKYFIFLIFLISFCASEREVVKREDVNKLSERKTRLDTRTILLDKVDNKQKKVEISSSEFNPNIVYDSTKREELEKQEIKDGFRVQVMVTSSRNTALSLKKILKKKFSNYEVYLIYKKPLYKVRIGDFLDKKKAERLRRHLIANGYSDSWVVSDKVSIRSFSEEEKGIKK